MTRPTPSIDKLDIAPSDLRLAWTAEGHSGCPFFAGYPIAPLNVVCGEGPMD